MQFYSLPKVLVSLGVVLRKSLYEKLGVLARLLILSQAFVSLCNGNVNETAEAWLLKLQSLQNAYAFLDSVWLHFG